MSAQRATIGRPFASLKHRELEPERCTCTAEISPVRSSVMDLVSQFDAIVAAIDAAGVEHAICGAFAVNILGHVRATMDIDLLGDIESTVLALTREAISSSAFRGTSGSMSASRRGSSRRESASRDACCPCRCPRARAAPPSVGDTRTGFLEIFPRSVLVACLLPTSAPR